MSHSETIYHRNMLALSSRCPVLSARLPNIDIPHYAEMVNSKTGIPVPAIRYDQKQIALHSRYNPEGEANRYAAIYPHSGFLVFLGFGAGYHIEPFLNGPADSHILIIEPDIELFKFVMQKVDRRKLLMDKRVSFLVGVSVEEVHTYLMNNYIPAITGNLQTIGLQPKMQINKQYFTDCIETIRSVIGKLADDYTVQAYFGKKWFLNTLFNMKKAASTTTTLPHVRKALVAGAGPSLEMQMDYLKNMKETATLISTDTALPSLLAHGVRPDIVISIDCQHVTYHHFLRGYPEGVPLVLDLASPVQLTRMADNLVFFSSGHPFSKYVSSRWRRFPYIDTSGGNVSHAAISLAEKLGAREIYLFGTDFSYPEGKTYARGTYIYHYFRSKAYKTTPIESLFCDFLFKNRNMQKYPMETGFLYTTKPMISYKQRLEEAVRHMRPRVVPVDGKGLKLNLKHEDSIDSDEKVYQFFSAGSVQSSWQEFITSYRSALLSMKEPYTPVAAYLEGLPPSERDLWTTMYPIAAAMRREREEDSFQAAELLSTVRQWTVKMAKEAEKKD